jgi:hypothetical protein
MWEFKRIEPKNIRLLKHYLENAKIGFSFFCSPYSLDIFFNHGSKELYLAQRGSEERLILARKKKFGNDVRILFDNSCDNDLIDSIKERFEVVYIASNLLIGASQSCSTGKCNNELITDTATIADLADRKIKHDYAIFANSHQNIRFEKINLSHKKMLMDFFEKWDRRPITQLRIKGMEQDKYFLDNYLDDSDMDGAVALDGDKIIGYEVFAPGCHKNTAVNLFNKCLRGYRQLGVRLYVEAARQEMAAGFSKVAIGEMNIDGQNDFKMRFAMNGEIIRLYSCEVFKDPKIKIHGDYLGSII